MNNYTAKLPKIKVFRDPIHGYVYINDYIIDQLIDTMEMQRLRRIKQLGTSSTTFHGAEHSRFNHSLGVYEIVRRIIDEIFVGREEWDDQDRLLALCAGLLHDVGHGPFSHSFERVFAVNHEEFTQAIILGDTEINAVLRLVAEDFPNQVADVIQKTSEKKLVISLISSQVDADRMDYLLRDAYYTGVSYGKFDFERILRVIRPSENGLVIKASGMHVVEDYIMCRYQMYRQVYFHPVSNSTEVLLTNIFKRVKYLFDTGYQFRQPPHHFISFFEGKIALADYLKLDEAIVLYYFSIWQDEEDSILCELCRRFLNRNLYKHIEFGQSADDQHKLEQMRALMQQVGIDPDYYLTVNASSNVAYDQYIPGKDEEGQPVSLLLPDGQKKELSQQSTIIGAINGLRNDYYYLYFPKDLVLALPESGAKQELMQLLGLSEHKKGMLKYIP